MFIVDVAVLILLSLFAIASIGRLIGLIEPPTNRPERWQHRAAITLALLLLVAFAAMRVFNVGPYEFQVSVAMAGVAVLLVVAILKGRDENADDRSPRSG